MVDVDDQRLDEEIQKQRETSSKAQAQEKLSETQSVHEEELVDQNGEFIIFKQDNSPEINNPQSQPSSFVSAASNEDSNRPSDLDEANNVLNQNLEPNFQKLNYVNKINILLKALIIERNKNQEMQIKVDVLKREYIQKVKLIANM